MIVCFGFDCKMNKTKLLRTMLKNGEHVTSIQAATHLCYIGDTCPFFCFGKNCF